jgi:hypothetical protein
MLPSLRALFYGCLGCVLTALSHADGSSIDKVYHPYVEPLEWELEWRMIQENESPATGQRRRQLHRVGLGKAVAETLFIEAYLIGEQASDTEFKLEAFELEALWQLSEQGEFFVDYGVLFELERDDRDDIWEYSTALLLEKEWGRFSTTANIAVGYEWGSDIDDEWESAVSLQARYRYSPRLEPALEVYLGSETTAMGPVLMGVERLGVQKALRWQLGVIFGMERETPDYTLRAVLEFEF